MSSESRKAAAHNVELTGRGNGKLKKQNRIITALRLSSMLGEQSVIFGMSANPNPKEATFNWCGNCSVM
ncbi:hypothetical protein Mettu_3114 [Methylobacter tundripaludum SV96]|uniref:Uncharacterized protein n=1 Tax=Methylobacter tundripaludum (strain ATCC BAA-1195 / DSM 17260 / SV96) TaxID=697282 RepID=G3IY68_METTV|nr:hypothetical protein Mettu_3114 [Methylobacter tundripaludum SV96]